MRYLLALLLIACGSTPAPTPTAPAPAVPPASIDPLARSPALAPLAWWVGDWVNDEGSEHWVAIHGALYGVALQDKGRFEVMIVDDAGGPGPADGIVRLYAMPGGTRSVEFRAESVSADRVVFANPANDAPKKISYERTERGLRASLHADANRVITFDWTAGTRVEDATVQAADVAFSAAVKERGLDAWLTAFDSAGSMMSKGERVTGGAITELMRPILTSGSLAWTPVAAGSRGPIGFTIGAATFTGATESWRSTYVTIWKQQADGSWKVLFDTGRPINE